MSGRPQHRHVLASLATKPVLSSGYLHPLKLMQKIVTQGARPAPRARVLADAVEQMRSHPGVRAGSVEPLGGADPDRFSDPTEPVARVSRKHPPRQKQGAHCGRGLEEGVGDLLA